LQQLATIRFKDPLKF